MLCKSECLATIEHFGQRLYLSSLACNQMLYEMLRGALDIFLGRMRSRPAVTRAGCSWRMCRYVRMPQCQCALSCQLLSLDFPDEDYLFASFDDFTSGSSALNRVEGGRPLRYAASDRYEYLERAYLTSSAHLGGGGSFSSGYCSLTSFAIARCGQSRFVLARLHPRQALCDSEPQAPSSFCCKGLPF